jgi:hypothetical protein
VHVKNQIKLSPLRLGAALATCALVAVSGSAAMAAQQTAPASSHPLVPSDKVPAYAEPYHGSLPKPGATGTAFPAASGSSSITRIVGGSPVSASAYPYIVGIETFFWAIDPSTGQPAQFVALCTGTVISSTRVLTAGHCDTDMAFGTTFVIAGRNTLGDSSSGYVAQVQSTWTDQNFNLAALNNGTAAVPVHDVSVLTLAVPLPSAYTPVQLAPANDSTTLAGLSATIVGYGETTAGDFSTVGTLNAATVPIQQDNPTCIGSELQGYDPTTMLCAGSPATTGGIDSCSGDSGGPLLITEGQATVEAGMTDWGSAACGTNYGVYEKLSFYNSEVTGAMNQPPIIDLDFYGGGHSGLMAIDGSGTLWYYAGSGFLNDGFGGFAGWWNIGSGWGGFKKVFRVTNWHNDHTESIMAVATNGNLYEYPTDGAGDFLNNGSATLIGTGWTKFSDIMVVNNWTGDGHADLLGRTSTGQLYLYETDGNGGWLNNGIGQLIGTGWNMFNTVLTPGTWTGDGHQALIGRTSTGGLYLYESDGQGGWLNNGIGIKIGTGWNIFNTFMSPGDFNGDGLVDLIGRNSSGALYLYETDGLGNWLNNGQGILIGQGWGGFKAIF